MGYVPEHHGHGYRWMTCGRLLQHVSAYYPAWEPAYAEHLSRALGLLDVKADDNLTNVTHAEAVTLRAGGGAP